MFVFGKQQHLFHGRIAGVGQFQPLEKSVPSIQKRLIRRARRAGKPVVVATQMLESMVHNPAPTRAETSDVATGVYDGSDALMLSAESAIGKYPIDSVKLMNRIIESVEKFGVKFNKLCDSCNHQINIENEVQMTFPKHKNDPDPHIGPYY